MNCYYCDKIRAHDASYAASPAAYDLASAAPRCPRHWRYVCGKCGQPAHFMSSAWCAKTSRVFCSRCALGVEEIADAFWGRSYYFRYRSPWSEAWEPALDRLEFETRSPDDRAAGAISTEPHLIRYPEPRTQWREKELTDEQIRASWNTNADRWDAGYDDDGDRNRRYHSDEPMLAMLGEVNGLRVLDVGSGNGYLSRKLSRGGAKITAVEQSERFLDIATRRESAEPLGIDYRPASATSMPFLADATFDKAVANYVLMDIGDYPAVVREVFRVLKRGGVFVVVISHPCFSCGPGGGETPAPDSPRREDQSAIRVDDYFLRGPIVAVWGNFDPVTGFHRPIRDYWETFTSAGFRVDGFEEPCISERGLCELPPSRVAYAQRITYSCIFRLTKI